MLRRLTSTMIHLICYDQLTSRPFRELSYRIQQISSDSADVSAVAVKVVVVVVAVVVCIITHILQRRSIDWSRLAHSPLPPFCDVIRSRSWSGSWTRWK